MCVQNFGQVPLWSKADNCADCLHNHATYMIAQAGRHIQASTLPVAPSSLHFLVRENVCNLYLDSVLSKFVFIAT